MLQVSLGCKTHHFEYLVRCDPGKLPYTCSVAFQPDSRAQRLDKAAGDLRAWAGSFRAYTCRDVYRSASALRAMHRFLSRLARSVRVLADAHRQTVYRIRSDVHEQDEVSVID